MILGFLFRAIFLGKEMEQGEDGMRAPPKENKEEYHELHFDRAVGLCGGNVWGNGTYDEKRGQCRKVLCRE